MGASVSLAKYARAAIVAIGAMTGGMLVSTGEAEAAKFKVNAQGQVCAQPGKNEGLAHIAEQANAKYKTDLDQKDLAKANKLRGRKANVIYKSECYIVPGIKIPSAPQADTAEKPAIKIEAPVVKQAAAPQVRPDISAPAVKPETAAAVAIPTPTPRVATLAEAGIKTAEEYTKTAEDHIRRSHGYSADKEVKLKVLTLPEPAFTAADKEQLAQDAAAIERWFENKRQMAEFERKRPKNLADEPGYKRFVETVNEYYAKQAKADATASVALAQPVAATIAETKTPVVVKTPDVPAPLAKTAPELTATPATAPLVAAVTAEEGALQRQPKPSASVAQLLSRDVIGLATKFVSSAEAASSSEIAPVSSTPVKVATAEKISSDLPVAISSGRIEEKLSPVSQTASVSTAIAETKPAAQSIAVEAGDILNRIAEATGRSCKSIAEKNDLKNWNLIFAGQVLNIDGLPKVANPADCGRKTHYSKTGPKL